VSAKAGGLRVVTAPAKSDAASRIPIRLIRIPGFKAAEAPSARTARRLFGDRSVNPRADMSLVAA
jgi:hypothetical protein